MIKIPAELKSLAEIFQQNGATLYIVGGFVRDSYLRIQSMIRNDIDLCSDVTPKKLKKILEGTKFEVKNINEPLGVMAIIGKKRYEHATFRKEVYETEGHAPNRVEFIKSLEEDAKRRDFKINAIYFNILEETYIDPLGGLDDLKDRTLTTVGAPKNVFNDDPERILRFIRFACSLGLKIPEEEMFYAKQNAYKIKFISKNRLRNEFERLLYSDEIYPDLLYTRDAHFRAMVLLGEIDAWKYILPAMDTIKNSNLVDYKGEKIYDHTLNCLKNASPKIRLAILLHDAGKVKTMERQHSFFGSREFIGVIVENNLGFYGLGFPKETVNNVIKIINGYEFNKFCLQPKVQIKNFIFNNKDVIDNIIEIKTVIKNESRSLDKSDRSAEILRKVYDEMISHAVPFERSDLKINGEDIIKNFPKIRLENLERLLEELHRRAVINFKLNSKDKLIKEADKLINSNRDIYL